MDLNDLQKQICNFYDAKFEFAEPNSIIGVSDNVFSGLQPLNGLRHPIEGNACGWYIFAGDDILQEDDFFKPYHLYHIIELIPSIKKYLGLPPGYRFLLGNNDYEDVWFDENLLDIS